MHDEREIQAIFSTSLGWIGVRVTPQGVRALAFDCDSAVMAQQALWRDVAGSAADQHRPTDASDSAQVPLLVELQQRLTRFAAGESTSFADLPLDLRGTTDFQQRVWIACRDIPLGQTRTYAQLAAEVGTPRAARAVGSAMARNRIPLVIPCHRVVGCSGGLGGFSSRSGLEMKRRLLSLEAAAGVTASRRDAENGAARQEPSAT